MDIQNQITWLRAEAETPDYMPSTERQNYCNVADTLEKLNVVVEAARPFANAWRMNYKEVAVSIDDWRQIRNALAALEES